MVDVAYKLYVENDILWVDQVVNPIFLQWFKQHNPESCKTLVVGCGLGDDAASLAKKGFHVTAFDISERVIEEGKKRFENPSNPHCNKA